MLILPEGRQIASEKKCLQQKRDWTMETLKETILNSCNMSGILQLETCEIALITIPRIFIVYVKFTWVLPGVFVADWQGFKACWVLPLPLPVPQVRLKLGFGTMDLY